MRKKTDQVDAYYLFVSDKIMRLAPLIGASAAATFTAARLCGWFAYVELIPLVCFDFVCLSYFLAAYLLRRYGIMQDGEISEKHLSTVELVMDGLILLQWNLITYIFPTRAFWGYAPMFVLLTAFMFRTKSVLMEIAGISVSIAVSWIVKGDLLLPAADELFAENLILRIVALVISFSVIAILTYFSGRFAALVKDNFRSIEKKNEELEGMGKDIIDFTAEIIEERDSTSGSHVKRLKTYTRILAEQVAASCPEYGLTEEAIEQITLACVLHDVGKIAIPDRILLKPGKLTPEEFDIIKSHTVLGVQIVDKLPDSVGEEYKRCCRDICRFHHEKYDGKGYPVGLKGDDIPISAQIVSVVDCFDALSHERPYKPALPGEVAIQMILRGECGVFSEKMKACLLACRERFLNV